jgi:ATP synthase F1 delta subunit
LEIIDRFKNRVLEYKGIVPGTLIARAPLGSEQVAEIKKRIETLTGKEILLSEQADQTMMGGFIVKIEDTVIDLSINTQLEKLRNRLVHE